MIPNIAAFKTLIKDRVGLHFFNGMEGLLNAALQQRISERGKESFEEYYEILCVSTDEFDKLLSLLTINETYFFREPDVLDIICDKLVPRILEQRSGPVRILSAGCSSGEEAYSLAIKLHQKYHDKFIDNVEIHGCDIDTKILEKARAAIYSSYSFRGVDPLLQQSYFTRNGNQFQLHDVIRNKVKFHRANIVKEQLQPTFDIILLRNVSIYFDVETRRALHFNLLNMLQPEGALFFGNAETLANNFGILKLKQEFGNFYFCQPKAARTQTPAVNVRPRIITPVIPAAAPFIDAPVPSAQQCDSWIKKALACVADKRFSEAEELIGQVLNSDIHNLEALVIKGAIALEKCEFEQTALSAKHVLELDEWSAEAKMLLGLAMMWQQHTQQAIAWFKQVVYQQPGYWPAHYYLAEMYRQSELYRPAQRTYRITLQLLNAEMSNTGNATALRLPLSFPSNSFRFLCEHQLAQFTTQDGQ
ncbi:chemotaxis protein CheR [Buttiauxella sp. A2-C1_F]|uniref:CheR family methyltransferase n=1 Tax=unclassified Buttiauxella TaxID=2634062 RepID=UPI001E4FBE70|nr:MULTISPECIES: protein-glutamate O-methyltransferase CheR [unclassified Buttiauxella]MCE0802260.1 chemotaxis protein CheR [Buttiauxella sp. W03-F01]MCE0813938.1 chemotaxis protein CheR [Buttiauxella sp. S04-F03]MCE0847195.1 chemotaxis protein CheR [Buttiauxella sp. A2-C1_F]